MAAMMSFHAEKVPLAGE